MKKVLTLIVLLTLLTKSFSQETTSSKPVTREDFLKESRGQRVLGGILLGVGATTLIVAANGNVDFGTLGYLAALGGVTTLASIPLLIASARNQRKANALSGSFKMEKISLLNKATLAYNYYPSISLKLNL